MIGVTLPAINYGKFIYSTSLQIHHLQVGFRMPDRECTIVSHGIKNHLAIGRDTWMTDTPLRENGINLITDLSGLLIEGDTNQPILQLSDILRKNDAISFAIVDVLAVG